MKVAPLFISLLTAWHGGLDTKNLQKKKNIHNNMGKEKTQKETAILGRRMTVTSDGMRLMLSHDFKGARLHPLFMCFSNSLETR